MASDLFFTQLVTQSFSSGSSFGNAATSATGNQPGNITGTHDMSGGEASFEHTLQRASDTSSNSAGSAPSGDGQTAPQEHADPSAGPADISQEGAPTDNLLGVSQSQQTIGNDGATDPNLSSGMNKLMAILNELQGALMLDNPSGSQLQLRQGAANKVPVFFDTLNTNGDQAAMSTGGNPGLLEKLQALLKQFEAAGEAQHKIEIQSLIEKFNSASGGHAANGDAAKMANSAELVRLIQNLAALSSNGMVKADGSNQAGPAVDLSQAGNLTASEKPVAADMAKVLTASTASSNGTSVLTAQQGLSENQAQVKQTLARTVDLAAPKTVSSAENAGVQVKVNAQTPASIPEANEIKNPIPGQKDIQGLQINKAPEGGFNQDNSAPTLQANASVQQNDAALQSAKVVNLKTDGAGTEAAVGKMAPAESGNSENGFSFNSQQQNDLKPAERLSGSEQPEMVQRKFQAQTLDQIVQKAALHLKNGQNEMQINLKPDFLGQIRMQIITDSQHVTVRIMAEFPMVKELIENNAHQLRNELQNHGLDIDKLEVSVSQHSDQQVADQNKAGGSSGNNDADKKADAEDGESDNSTAVSSASDSQDDLSDTRIDFFA